jgi:hypothetical protein
VGRTLSLQPLPARARRALRDLGRLRHRRRDDRRRAIDLRWHVAAEGGMRGFCGRCGSPMFFKSERWPGELHIARALFLEPLDRAPQAHVFYETHVEWATVGDELPKKSSPS